MKFHPALTSVFPVQKQGVASKRPVADPVPALRHALPEAADVLQFRAVGEVEVEVLELLALRQALAEAADVRQFPAAREIKFEVLELLALRQAFPEAADVQRDPSGPSR